MFISWDINGYKPYNYGHGIIIYIYIYPLMTGTYWNNISSFAMNSGQKLSPVFVCYQQQMWGYEQIYYCRLYYILFIFYFMKLYYTYCTILYDIGMQAIGTLKCTCYRAPPTRCYLAQVTARRPRDRWKGACCERSWFGEINIVKTIVKSIYN